MQCLSCQKEIPLQLGFVTQPYRYCKKCFLYQIERRVRNSIREHHPLKKGQRVVVQNSVARYFLEQVVHVPLVLVKKSAKKTDLIVSSATSDDFVVSFLEHILFGKKIARLKKNILYLFASLTDEELALYCHYRNLSFVPAKNTLKDHLHALEQRHSGTMHALAKSMKDLQMLVNKKYFSSNSY